jgi:hypothetical protein
MQRQKPSTELLKKLHDAIIELIDAVNITDEYAAAEHVCETHPKLRERFGLEAIRQMAKTMIHGDLPDLSSQFTELFQEFNTRYFGGRLPTYKVEVGYAADWLFTRWDGLEICDSVHYRVLRLIRIRARKSKEEMVCSLLNEMAHVATNDFHGPKWAAQIERLVVEGAPTYLTQYLPMKFKAAGQ